MGFLLFVGACEKASERIDCKLYVVQSGTDLPVAGAKVLVFETEPAAYNFDTSPTAAHAVVYTDANGQAKLYFKAKPNMEYRVLVSCSKYLDSYASNSVYPQVPTGNKKSITVGLLAKGFVKLHLKNTSPYDSTDVISVKSCSSKKFAFSGKNVDTTFLYCLDCSCYFTGNSNYTGAYWVIKNNAISPRYFGFKTQNFDTIKVDINY
jgi:hypothetical protein